MRDAAGHPVRARIVSNGVEHWPSWVCREAPFCPVYRESIDQGILYDEDILAVQG